MDRGECVLNGGWNLNVMKTDKFYFFSTWCVWTKWMVHPANQENFTQISMSYNPNIWIELCQMQRLQITGIMKNYPEYWMAFFSWNQHTLFRKNKVRDTPDVEKEDLLIFLNVITWGGICMCVFAFKTTSYQEFTSYQ